MLPQTRFEATHHFRENYARRVLNGVVNQGDRVVPVRNTDWAILDPLMKQDFLGARAPTKMEKKTILTQWHTPTQRFHPTNVVVFNPRTKTVFICEINRFGAFVGRTCFKLNDLEKTMDYYLKANEAN